MQVNSLPYSFLLNLFWYSVCVGGGGGHYQWILKLLTQIVLCEHVFDNGAEHRLLNRNFKIKI